MRSLTESRQRWDETMQNGGTLAALQRAVKFDGPSSPCEAGCRSVCWKVFLLFRDAPVEDRVLVLREARADYAALSAEHLQFIRHPELLAEMTVDPLADDPESPWDTFRRDDAVRAEILQDVLRLPDDPFYHQEHVQTLILDVLFVYFKRNPDIGGYRQGMHELLAPIVNILSQDAIDPPSQADAGSDDEDMLESLDARYIEHDAYALFSKIMERAKGFYHITNKSDASFNTGGNGPVLTRTLSSAGGVEESAIVEMSKEIHEVTLMKIDPELAVHLKNIEILPQIFLIRWIRLLFGREFPFGQLLVLWDSIFAFDPTLRLIPLICVAMLLRIRWDLLEADYSVALQLLLKYPPPQPPHGPHTFVDDAIFLQDHLNAAGGNSLVLKYTGRSPSNAATPRSSSESHRPSTPTSAIAAGLGNLRNRTLMAGRSPLASVGRPSAAQLAAAVRNTSTSPSRFAGGREGVGAFLQGAQGAAKGVMERGERLGINQAVRDAVGEIRRNMAQGIQDARQAAKSAGRVPGPGPTLSSSFDPSGPSSLRRRRTSSIGQAVRALADMEKRNRQLALMLDETVESLKLLAQQAPEPKANTGKDVKSGSEDADGDKNGEASITNQSPSQEDDRHWLDAVELAAAKIQFVKVHLEDSSLQLPLDEPLSGHTDLVDTPMVVEEDDKTAEKSGGNAHSTRETSLLPAAEVEPTDGLRQETVKSTADTEVIDPLSGASIANPSLVPAITGADSMDLDGTDDMEPAATTATKTDAVSVSPSIDATQAQAPPQQEHTLPTRSTLAQSSFAWMLEPEDTAGNNGRGSGRGQSNGASGASSSSKGKGAPRANPAGRGRHAFLFGEVVGNSPLGNGDGGGGDEDPLSGGKKKRGSQSGVGSDGRSRSITADEVFGLEPLRKSLPKS